MLFEGLIHSFEFKTPNEFSQKPIYGAMLPGNALMTHLKCLRLIVLFKDLITRALERQCAKQNVKRSAQATSTW
jgi:hypothetical protein